MSGLFRNFNDDPRMQRAALSSKYNAARMNLLLVVIFTVINIITLSTGFGGYFLFSASVPYLITELGMIMCGKYPAEYYEGMDMSLLLDKSSLIFFVIIALLVTSLYLICWFFSKKKGAKWLKFALALFSADAMVMILMGNRNTLLFDAVFHVWILFILVSGIKAYSSLKALDKEDKLIEVKYNEVPDEGNVDEEVETLDADYEE